ncbi:hypothetical protein DTO207G8_7815 [Paecilomyces variotii]|nr:hypothetical protein DTO207G8_7815 [Paecilomyces variotii]
MDQVSQDAAGMLSCPDPKWPANPAGLFDTFVVDEAHIIRNVSSSTSQTVMWLMPKFYLLPTATPYYNSVNDFFTLVRFISPVKDYYNKTHLSGETLLRAFDEERDNDLLAEWDSF